MPREPLITATYRHELPFSAEVKGTTTRFRFWAPAQDQISLVIRRDDHESILGMERELDGWFALTTEAPAGSHYHYQLRDGLRVPDPASRFQPDDVHGMSEVINPEAYAWRNADWRGRPWEEVVLYESHVGCFTPEGTFDSFRRKLDHLARVGVTAIELMPLGDFEGRRNWGYDGVLPFAPDSSYGRPEDLKRLIDEAHERQLMMFLDVVYNHFGPSGNYLSLYAPGFFTDHYKTPWGAAINFENHAAEVRRFFIENAKYWLQEYRFDGLRFDAVHAILDSSTPHFMQEMATAIRTSVAADRHVHLVLENADNTSRYLDRKEIGHYNAQWNDDYHHAAHVISTGEGYGYYSDFAIAPVTLLARSLASGFVYQGEPSGHWQGRKRGEPSTHLPATAFINFLQNHDQIGNRADAKRRVSLTSLETLRALTAVTLLCPSIPMLFMGEEWATARHFNFFCDFQGDLREAVRKGRQDEFAHMRRDEPGGAEAAQIDPNDETVFRQSQLDWNELSATDHKTHLELVQRLLDLRKRHVVPRLADIQPRGHYDVHDGRALRVQWIFTDGGKLTVAANLSSRVVTGLNWQLPGRIVYASHGTADGEVVDTLPPWSVNVHLADGQSR